MSIRDLAQSVEGSSKVSYFDAAMHSKWFAVALIVSGVVIGGGLIALGAAGFFAPMAMYITGSAVGGAGVIGGLILLAKASPRQDTSATPTTHHEEEQHIGKKSEGKPSSLDIFQYMKELPLGQTPSAPDAAVDMTRFLHTVDMLELPKADPGVYAFVILREQFKMMQIKTEERSISVIVRESSQQAPDGKKGYRLLLSQSQLSEIVFTAPQISAMIRAQHKPPKSMRVSGLTTNLFPVKGLIVFTDDLAPGASNKKYYLINPQGAFQEVKNIETLISFAAQ